MKTTTRETILVLGGDGYLGWTLGLAFANRLDATIVLVDSMIKRTWEKEVDAKLLVPLKKPSARVRAYKKLYGKTNLSFKKLDLMNAKAVDNMVAKYNPTVIVNAAQQPSAPYSMMNAQTSATTFGNNTIGHLNVLWAIAQNNKDIRYIKLGSAGCYMDVDTDFVPLGKKDFTFMHRGKTHTVRNSFMPMQATDFYHQSKASDFLIDDLCAKVWGLKVLTVQQSTIFGATIPENHDPRYEVLSARFNYDAVFSTVMNRFICQVAIGHPMTIYGDGTQRTGVISLNDTVENFMRFITMDLPTGEHTVVHNYTHRLSIEDIARKIAAVEPGAEVQYIRNPRKEPEGQQSRQVQMHPAIKERLTAKEQRLQTELAAMVEFTKRHAHRIDRSIIMPKVTWAVDDAEIEETIAMQTELRPETAVI